MQRQLNPSTNFEGLVERKRQPERPRLGFHHRYTGGSSGILDLSCRAGTSASKTPKVSDSPRAAE